MGTLIYGTFDIGVDDRLLTHLQIVIVNKLRHNEPVLVSWLDDPSIGDGRSAMWVSPYVPLYFKFLGSRVPAIDRDWLTRLTDSSNSASGLILQDQQGRLARATGIRGSR